MLRIRDKNVTYWLHIDHIVLLFFNHGLEVHIDFDAQRRIVLLPHRPLLLNVVHSAAALLSVNLQSFDLVEA